MKARVKNQDGRNMGLRPARAGVALWIKDNTARGREMDTAAFSCCGESQIAERPVLNSESLETDRAGEKPRRMSS